MAVTLMHESELAQVWALAHQLWPDEPRHDFRNEIVFVWDRGAGALGGFASVSVRPWVEGCDTAPCPHVEGWFVEADVRRKGAGRALIAAIEDWCSEHGFGDLTSDTGLSNPVSQRAHKALGFEPTEHIVFYKKRIRNEHSAVPITIDSFPGPRSDLMPLFMQADDSPREISTYIDLGEVLVARRSGHILGHVQLIVTGQDAEIKSVAVHSSEQHQGVGGALMKAAIARAFREGAARVRAATATADIDSLRFYQRLGFRAERVERDVFTADRGYPLQEADGIPVRDRLWFSKDDNN